MQEGKREQPSEEQEGGQRLFSWQSSEEVSRWSQQSQWREQLFAEATRLMLAAAELGPGDYVLDIAAGTGDQTLLAVEKVGPTGKILATDVSAAMLKEAASLVEARGLTNITTRVMNAEQLDLPDQTFDAAICRLGLMLVQRRDRAFLEIHRVLKQQRKLAALVWSTPDHNPFLAVPFAIVAKYVGQPANAPTPFALGEPGAFEQAFKVAGFREVRIQAIPLQFPFASMEAFFQGPVFARALGQLNQADKQRLQEDVEQAVRQFEGPQGLIFPAEMLLGVGTR